MLYKRQLDLPKLLNLKSFFLFGARATGKSTLIREQLPEAQVIDLLDSKQYGEFLRRPELLSTYIQGEDKVIVIDEIQKLPALLDEVHRLIFKHKTKFLLTGSSARKLKHGGSNLLAGRAWQANLFPLTSQEISNFSLDRYLQRGGLPDAYLSDHYKEELKNYTNLYLREEIKAEAVTRNVAAFAEFLDLVGISNGQEINYERFASDLQISPSTLKNYIGILKDTLIAFVLKGYSKTRKRKGVSRGKIYLFDVGVANHLSRKEAIAPKTKDFGDAFEHFIVLEIRAAISYFRKNGSMTYWRTHAGHEVDILIDNNIAIECKSTSLVQDRDLKGLRALRAENIFKEFYIISLDSKRRKTEDGIHILPCEDFLNLLWSGELLGEIS